MYLVEKGHVGEQPADVTINKTIPSKPVLMICDIWSESGSIKTSKLLAGRWLYACGCVLPIYAAG